MQMTYIIYLFVYGLFSDFLKLVTYGRMGEWLTSELWFRKKCKLKWSFPNFGSCFRDMPVGSERKEDMSNLGTDSLSRRRDLKVAPPKYKTERKVRVQRATLYYRAKFVREWNLRGYDGLGM
jgi:hypothetical protein